ncbi:MAG: tetraacyldisaccharide 4'-kinase [Parachlamydiaceae bacterium]
MSKSWEFYFLSIIKGEKKGFLAAVVRWVLLLLSYPFKCLVSLRNVAFDHGWLRSYYPPVPLVISIGNITAGGTGKTPVTLMIAEEFKNKVPLAILSRGYRAQAEKFCAPIFLNKSKGVIHPASLCGDEPYLLADNLPDAFIIVGKDRYMASKMAARFGAQVILLDDGMQHRKIARDLEVVVLDLLDPFGQGYFLPRGLLREGVSSLARADLIILNHAEDHARFEAIKRQISQSTSAPVVATKMATVDVLNLQGKSVGSLDGKKVGIFCGIAHPEYFRKTIQATGAMIVGEHFFPDHDALNLNELQSFGKECLAFDAELLVCTEKDRVKISDPVELCLPICWVKSKLKVIEGEAHWNSFIDRAKMTLRMKD